MLPYYFKPLPISIFVYYFFSLSLLKMVMAVFDWYKMIIIGSVVFDRWITEYQSNNWFDYNLFLFFFHEKYSLLCNEQGLNPIFDIENTGNIQIIFIEEFVDDSNEILLLKLPFLFDIWFWKWIFFLVLSRFDWEFQFNHVMWINMNHSFHMNWITFEIWKEKVKLESENQH